MARRNSRGRRAPAREWLRRRESRRSCGPVLAIPSVNGFALKIDAERNSIFHSLSGHVPWIVGVRFEHSFTVPMLRIRVRRDTFTRT